MNTLLLFFAFPIAVIIVSAILQKVLNNEVAVAALIFAIFLVITFAFFDETFLIATLAYSILSYITAFIVRTICASNNNEEDTNDSCSCMNRSSIVDETVTNNLNNNSNINTYKYNRYRRY